MIMRLYYLVRIPVLFLIFMLLALPLMADKVPCPQPGNAFTNALFPGFARPDRQNVIIEFSVSHRVTDPRLTLKLLGQDVGSSSGLDEPGVVDNLFRLRF